MDLFALLRGFALPLSLHLLAGKVITAHRESIQAVTVV
jgi:hypothetical protein